MQKFIKPILTALFIGVVLLTFFSTKLQAQEAEDKLLYDFFNSIAPKVKFYNKPFSSDSLINFPVYLSRVRSTRKEVYFSKIDSVHYFGVLNNFFLTERNNRYAEESDIYLFCLDAQKEVCLIFDLSFPALLASPQEIKFWPKKDFMFDLIVSTQYGILFNTRTHQMIRDYYFNFYQSKAYYNIGRGIRIDLYKKENKQYYRRGTSLTNDFVYKSAEHLLTRKGFLKFFELMVSDLSIIEDSEWSLTSSASVVLKQIDKDYNPQE